jgi:hypothetical protein
VASTAISKLSELASQLRRSVAGFTLPDKGGTSLAEAVAPPSAGDRVASATAAGQQKPPAAPAATALARRRHSG